MFWCIRESMRALRGEKHTVEEWGKALEEFAEYQCQQDKEERTWQDHIMDRFMRRI